MYSNRRVGGKVSVIEYLSWRHALAIVKFNASHGTLVWALSPSYG